MRCRQLMASPVPVVRATDNAKDCARLMRDQRISFLAVLNDRSELVGWVTERDIAVHVIADGRMGTTPVTQVMSQSPLTCDADEEVTVVARRLEARQGVRVLVMQDGKLVGYITRWYLEQYSDAA